jgi:hypothetical protein
MAKPCYSNGDVMHINWKFALDQFCLGESTTTRRLLDSISTIHNHPGTTTAQVTDHAACQYAFHHRRHHDGPGHLSCCRAQRHHAHVTPRSRYGASRHQDRAPTGGVFIGQHLQLVHRQLGLAVCERTAPPGQRLRLGGQVLPNQWRQRLLRLEGFYRSRWTWSRTMGKQKYPSGLLPPWKGWLCLFLLVVAKEKPTWMVQGTAGWI